MIQALESLNKIIHRLRSENGCPWDKKQTMQSLDPLFLEECYELSEAIHQNNIHDIKEELGDVTFMLLLMSRIAEQDKNINLSEIYAQAEQKLVFRHPHVFGDLKCDSPEEVIQNWEKLKKQEKTERSSSFDGIPKSLPPALRFDKICRKIQNQGDDLGVYQDSKDQLVSQLLDYAKNGNSLNDLLIQVNQKLEQQAREKGL